MSPRKLAARLPAVAAVAATAIAVPTLAEADSAAPKKKAGLDVKGGVVFKPNRMVGDTMRFGRDVTVIRSGGTLTIRNRTEAPHTFSLVRRSQVPRNARQMDACFEGGVCAELMQAHEASEEDEGPPKKPLVNVGAEGFDRPGDSIFFAPKGRTTVKITAGKGSTLSFICVPHPWMQGTLKVR
jgi:plastocyanin